ncbi:MAG: rhodanese-like domain-containing protein [Myxococcales bacterium]|nr:rhodanese-like domain-containing protein [Myxococcales bacterium]
MDTNEQRSAPHQTPATAQVAELVFERAPGGVPEVSVDWVREHGGRARLIDIRDRLEFTGPEGHISGIEWIPMEELTAEAAEWDPTRPIVLVCRSGRRSARAVRMLEEQGFRAVASMTGGMFAWRLAGHERAFSAVASAHEARARPPAGLDAPLTAELIAQHVGAPEHLRRVKVAALMLHGTIACVDGRDEHAVFGTPGGDMGELVLALTVFEQIRGVALAPEELRALFHDHAAAFGDFYMHTDTHALSSLRDAIVRIPLPGVTLPADASVDAALGVVLRPPRAAELALLELLVEPEFVGCGHLRLILEHPDEYRVRRELLRELIALFFRELWSGDRRLHYVVLNGEHHEGAVLNVEIPGAVHAYTRVPAIPPRFGGRAMFVYHPQIAAFIRDQQALFFTEHDAWQGVALEDYRAQLEALAQAQLRRTLQHLAPALPVFTVRVGPDTVEVIA